MFRKLGLLVLAAIITIVVLNSCEKGTEPNTQSKRYPYITLKIGDIHQYKNKLGNAYFQWEVVGTTKRTDSLEVFVFDEWIILSNEIWKGQNYYYLNDEYCIITQLDTIDSLEIELENPFFEQRIAKIHPDEGDYYQTNIGVPESGKIFMSISFIDSLVTYAKTFESVANYIATTPDTSENNKYYYAKSFGHVGTVSNSQSGTTEIYATYCKSDTSEIGVYIPFTSNKLFKLDKKKSIFSYLFKKQTLEN